MKTYYVTIDIPAGRSWGYAATDLQEASDQFGQAANGTHPAIDMIPKDIVICDWHYEVLEDYPSIAHFLEKGFPVLPGSWRNVEAGELLLDAALSHKDHPQMLGYLCTTWGAVKPGELAAWPPIQMAMGRMAE